MPIYYVDNITNGIPLLDLYERTGNEKYMTGAQRLAAYLLKYPADSRGNLPYRLRDGSHIYADGIGMVCPFLCRYGILTEDTTAVKLSVVQWCTSWRAGWTRHRDCITTVLTAIPA